MVSDAELLEEMDAGLAHVAQLQLDLADRLHRVAQATEDASELEGLAKALEGTGRSIRLTYALRVKIRKDVRALQREEARIAEDARDRASARHWDAVRSRVETLVWNEIDWETEDEDDFADRLEHLMDLEALDPDFRALPFEAQADRLIQKLGFSRPPGRPGPSAAMAPPPGGDRPQASPQASPLAPAPP